ncbi:MAG: hypothetical protein CME64_10550 [Halobacteriovoraceae bacterium]|nr:hypothetical protein [Halobacteriovoraceae bacterium]|tara:strand:+ start:40571 stop:41956 length:1386 start_codon:yes stop_codon:yes gene_type:complete
MKWAQCKVFERVSNIYTFSKDPLLQKNIRKHIFIPWDSSQAHNLMFKLKALIENKGSCFIPFMERDLRAGHLKDQVFEEIKAQIDNGIETHLVMSNYDSIHILRIDGICKTEEIKKKASKLCLEDFKNNDVNYNIWFEVGDLFVYKANHAKDPADIQKSLESLIVEQQTQNLFVTAQTIALGREYGETYSQHSRWLEMKRNLTYDYFIRNCELQDNVYQQSWEVLSKRSQHFLIVAEQARHKAFMYRDIEKTELLKESLESYISAVINELNEVYIRPLINAFEDYPCLREAWDEIQMGLVHPRVKSIINEMLDSESDQLKSLETFLEYFETAKSLLFSLKSRFVKKIGKEEYLLLENFLCRQESLVESFSCRSLDSKVKSLIQIKDWMKGFLDRPNQLSTNELKELNLKLTHLLTIMCSISYEDNIFFKLVEEKTAKGVLKRSFEEEVKALTKGIPIKKSA